MDFTGLANAIMQLIFIITGIVSIKSLTEMITQLVGQGDALKDGTDTGKDVKKVAGQATGAAIHGAQIAKKGMQASAGVASRVANSTYGKKVRNAAGDWVGRRKDNRNAWIENETHKVGANWYARQVRKHRKRVAADNKYLAKNDLWNQELEKVQEWEHLAQDSRNKGDIQSAKIAEKEAQEHRKLAKQHAQDVIDMDKNGVDGRKISRRGHWRADGHDLAFVGRYAASGSKQIFKNATGFEDGIGISAMLKGDKSKDTAINQFLHGSATKQENGKIVEREKNNFATTVNNANKFVFNITGAKGSIKDFLDNADVLGGIEEGNSKLAKQMQKIIAQTGVKSDGVKATKAAQSQAQETANAMKVQTDAINETMKSIAQALEDIKSKMP